MALGVSYLGQAYQGWQSQASGRTVQDHLQKALSTFAAQSVSVVCAGRTDAGVHALNQVVHFDAAVQRDTHSWVRGTNRYLPRDIAVQWAQPVAPAFHARYSAHGRRYVYLLLESMVRPALEAGRCGWVFRPLDEAAMLAAAQQVLGEHDFTSFRAAECQAATPVKTLRRLAIHRRGAYWRFEFEANAFLHHMVRNLMGGLIFVGTGQRPAAWMGEVLAARNRAVAAPTFAADGLYFDGPYYDAAYGIPTTTAAHHWLP